MDVKALNPFYNLPLGPSYITFFDDFTDEYTETEAASPWIGTALSSGTIANSDEFGGALILDNATTTDDSGYQIQADTESFGFFTDKETWVIARFKVNNNDAADSFVGLAITDTTAWGASGVACTDAVGFMLADGSSTLKFVVYRDSVLVNSIDVATLADSTYGVYAFRAEMSSTAGIGTFTVYADGAQVGQTTCLTVPYSGEEVLAPTIAHIAGAAEDSNLTIDYFGVLIQR